MSQSSLLKVAGLYSFPNHLSAIPQGALLLANNIVINRDSIAESRRGYQIYGTSMGSSIINTAHQLLNYKGRILRHWGSGSGQFLEVDSDGAGTFTQFDITLTSTTHSNMTVDGITSTAPLNVGMFVTGSNIPANTTITSIINNSSITISNNASTSTTLTLTFTFDIEEVVEGLRIKYLEANGNLYFTTFDGVKKISAPSASALPSLPITPAGGIKALDLTATLDPTPGFLLPQSSVAYRGVWGINDLNNNEILGTPSGRVVIENTDLTNSMTVDIRVTIPKTVTTAYFFQLYRTPNVSAVTSFTIIGDTHGTTVIDNIADTSSLLAGMSIAGSNIPSNTTILSISSTTSIIISNAATSSISGETLTVSQDLNTDPGDEEALAYEYNPTLTDLNNGYLSFTDITPDSFLGANLYTNANSGEGIAQANDVPPLCQDLVNFKGYTFYANTTTLQSLNLSLLGVSQLVAGVSTLTITDGVTSNTYTFNTAENIATKQVLISTASTPAQQVYETSQSLIRVINNQSTEIVYTYYLSGPTDVPGLMLFQARNFNQNAFYLNVDSATTTGIEFSPNIPVSGQTVISTDSVSPNRIYYSKFQQPEAVPILNYIDVGPKDQAIVRILALRDNLFVLKQEGVYRISGLVAPFTLYPFDFSTIIRAADSAVVLNNLVYLFSNQGIATLSDTGVAVISRPIEDEIIDFLTPQYTNFSTATFGVSYESDRAYYLSTVTNIGDVFATQCFRFNTFTNSWTLLNISKRCGVVNTFDDTLYWGATDINDLEQERKSFTRTDYADRQYSMNLVANSVNKVNVILPSISNVTVGDVVVQLQNLTIPQFNRLLTKLDNDAHLSPHNYVSTLTANPGINLANQLDALVTKIADDAGRLSITGNTSSATYLALIGTGTGSFSALQTEFNNLIALLNADVGVVYKNYMISVGTTSYEFNIVNIISSTKTVVATYTYPLIVGPLIVYNHINVDLQFVPQFFGDVSMTKHVSEGTFIFEDASFTSAAILYASDLSANFDPNIINGNGNGIFGNNVFGQGVFGGNGSGIPFRTYIPTNKQRCRYLNCRFQHSIAREIFSLYGISLTFNPVSQRGWR